MLLTSVPATVYVLFSFVYIQRGANVVVLEAPSITFKRNQLRVHACNILQFQCCNCDCNSSFKLSLCDAFTLQCNQHWLWPLISGHWLMTVNHLTTPRLWNFSLFKLCCGLFDCFRYADVLKKLWRRFSSLSKPPRLPTKLASWFCQS